MADVRIDVLADISRALRDIDRLEGREVRLRVRLDDGAVRSELRRLATSSPDVKLRVLADVSRARADIRSLSSVSDRLEVRVNADVSRARADIRSLGSTADRIEIRADSSRLDAVEAQIAALSGRNIRLDVLADVTSARSAIQRLGNDPIRVRVEADPSGFNRFISGAGDRSFNVARGTARRGAGVVGTAVGAGAGVAGVETLEEIGQSLVNVIGDTFSTTFEFQQATRVAGAKGGIDTDTPEGQAALDALSDFALALGNDDTLTVNPNEAVEASLSLTQQGIDLQRQFDSSLRSTIQLQNAAGGTFGLAAETFANFRALADRSVGPQLSDSDIANLLTGATLSSKFDINDLRLLSSQGGTAIDRGVSVQELVELAVVASGSGSGGSDVGTAIKVLSGFLDKQTNPAQEAFQELGVITSRPQTAADFLSQNFGITPESLDGVGIANAFREAAAATISDIEGIRDEDPRRADRLITDEAQRLQAQSGFLQNRFFTEDGTFAGVDNLINVIGETFGSLSDQALNNAIGDTFGTDGGRIVGNLANLDRAGANRRLETLRTTDAAQIARQRNETTQGRLDVLNDAIETAQIQFAESSLDPLADFFGDIGGFISEVAPIIEASGEGFADQLDPFLDQTTEFFGKVTAFANESGSLSEGLDLAIDDTFPRLGRFFGAVGDLTSGVSNLAGTQVGPEGSGVTLLGTQIDGVTNTISSVGQLLTATSNIVEGVASSNVDQAALGVAQIGGALDTLLNELSPAGLEDIAANIDGASSGLSLALQDFGVNLQNSAFDLLATLPGGEAAASALGLSQRQLPSELAAEQRRVADAARRERVQSQRDFLADPFRQRPIGPQPDPSAPLRGDAFTDLLTQNLSVRDQILLVGQRRRTQRAIEEQEARDRAESAAQETRLAEERRLDAAVPRRRLDPNVASSIDAALGFSGSTTIPRSPIAIETERSRAGTPAELGGVPPTIPVIPALEPVEPEAVEQPLFPVLDTIDPQEAIANMSIGTVEPIPDQEANANISWIIPPIPDQTVTVRARVVGDNVGGDTESNSTQDGGGDGGVEFRASGVQRTRGGRRYVVSEFDPEMIELPSGQRLLALNRGEIRPPANSRIYSGQQTRQELGIRDTTAATEAFGGAVRNLASNIERGGDERQIDAALTRIERILPAVQQANRAAATLLGLPLSPSISNTLPALTSSNFGPSISAFMHGGTYRGGIGLGGEVGPELIISNGRAGIIGHGGPELFTATPGAEIFDARTTERIAQAMGLVRSATPSAYSTSTSYDHSRTDSRTFNVTFQGEANRAGARQFVSHVRHMEASL